MSKSANKDALHQSSGRLVEIYEKHPNALPVEEPPRTYTRKDMNVIPPVELVFATISNALKTSHQKIEIDRDTIINLIDIFVSFWDFDEDYYLSTNQDVAHAIEQGSISSAWEHFRRHGYFEGRLPVKPVVDENWYLSTYPDVASAVLNGVVSGAEAHYEQFGRVEGRLPSKPAINVEWYAKRYLTDSTDKATLKACEKHFVKYGYLLGALPHRPK